MHPKPEPGDVWRLWVTNELFVECVVKSVTPSGVEIVELETEQKLDWPWRNPNPGMPRQLRMPEFVGAWHPITRVVGGTESAKR